MADKVNNLLSGILPATYAKSYYFFPRIIKEKKKPSALPKNKQS